MDKNDIEELLNEGVPVEEIAEKYSSDLCVLDCGIGPSSMCSEDVDCNRCWIVCLEKMLTE